MLLPQPHGQVLQIVLGAVVYVRSTPKVHSLLLLDLLWPSQDEMLLNAGVEPFKALEASAKLLAANNWRRLAAADPLDVAVAAETLNRKRA